MSGSHARIRCCARAPCVEVDVGRRRRRHHVDARPAADSCGVADEGDARGDIEIADMMLTRVRACTRPAARAQRPTASRPRRADCRSVRGTGGPRPTADPCPDRTAVRRWPGASSDRPGAARLAHGRRPRCGDALDDRAGRARVVEMDVREQDLADVAESGSPCCSSADSSVVRVVVEARDRPARRRQCREEQPWQSVEGDRRKCRST